MRAEDLMGSHPEVGTVAPASDVARALAGPDVRAVLLVDADRRLRGVITDAMLLRFLLPPYVAEAESLAGVLQEQAADVLWRRLEGRTAQELLSDEEEDLPEVEPDATLIEVASAMVATRKPVVAVLREGRVAGAITLGALLDRLLRP